ncbi:MAG: DUF1566 domain-containing protein [Desulfuromonadales bacterium]|nr:DUF1566 domain-containing protein [Desulfuromonadales bacterium]
MTDRFRTLTIAAAQLCLAWNADAGTLDAPGPPTSGASAMYTSSDLYNRLTSGTAGTKRSGPFVEPATAPGPTGHTIDEIMAVLPQADNANGATAVNVIAGKTFWGLRTDGTWGLKTGTLPLQSLNPVSTSVPAGYYAASSLNAVDSDLVSANIKSGVTILGVSGKPEVVDTTEAAYPAVSNQILAGRKAFVNGAAVTGTITPGANLTGANGALTIPIPDGLYSAGKTAMATDANLTPGNIRSGVTIFGVTSNAPPTPLPKTGQTTCYDSAGTVIDCAGTGQDGAWQKGIAPPTPRFTDNNNGTVTDNATGLVWLKNANCFGAVNWATSLSSANGLTNGYCGLTDGSTAGQWRLPNLKELQSLADFTRMIPALPSNNPFINIQYDSIPNIASPYWSANSYAGSNDSAWYILWYNGNFGAHPKYAACYIWPVRGGQ